MNRKTTTKWYERPVRMMRLDYIDALSRMKDTDLDALARSKKEEWHINCEWLMGTLGMSPGMGYVTTFNTPKFEKYAPLGDWDLIREYLPYARKYEIYVLAYLNMHWFSYEFADRNPGWEQLLQDGTPYGRARPLYGDGTTFCVNSGWRDWAQDMIIECMKTGIDGVFLDGPVIYPGCCYCDACRTQFLEQYGCDLSPTEDWSNPTWKDFVEFREDSMARFLADCRKAMKSVNEEGVIFLNAGSWHAGAWRVARDIEKVGKHQDFNGAEAFFHPGPRSHILHFWATAAKHLVAGKKPAIVFSHHALGSWHYIPLPPVEAGLAVAQTVACGANPWIAVFDYALDHSRENAVKPIRDIHEFLEANEQYFCGTESAADIALLYSRQSAIYWVSDLEDLFGEHGTGREQDLIADVTAGKKVKDWQKRKSICDQIHGDTYLGYFTALTREHIPFDVILDADLTHDALRKYKCVILGNAACLSDEQIQTLEHYCREGGSIIAEFETGRYDERGNLRSDNSLGTLLGISHIDGMFAPSVAEEYVKVKGRHDITSCFNPGQLIARPQFALRISPKHGAESPIVFMNPIGRLYSAPRGESSYPAVLLQTLGKGHIIYFPALIGEFYARYRMAEYQSLIAECIKWARATALPIEVQCPSTIQVELRHQTNPERVLVHLVNNTGDMQRPMSEIIPVYNIRIVLHSQNVRKIRALRLGKELDFARTDDGVEFTLPELGMYEVVVAEL